MEVFLKNFNGVLHRYVENLEMGMLRGYQIILVHLPWLRRPEVVVTPAASAERERGGNFGRESRLKVKVWKWVWVCLVWANPNNTNLSWVENLR